MIQWKSFCSSNHSNGIQQGYDVDLSEKQERQCFGLVLAIQRWLL